MITIKEATGYFSSEYEDRYKNDYKGWDEEDIELHQSINWAERNYKDYDTGKSIQADVHYYDVGNAEHLDNIEMHLFLRANPIYPPYYKPVENPFGKGLGPMYDGDDYGKYGIHNRYESPELYDILST